MRADDLMEHGVLGVSRTIHGLCTRHPLGYRASSSAPMPRDGYTRSRALDVTTVAARLKGETAWSRGGGMMVAPMPLRDGALGLDRFVRSGACRAHSLPR